MLKNKTPFDWAPSLICQAADLCHSIAGIDLKKELGGGPGTEISASGIHFGIQCRDGFSMTSPEYYATLSLQIDVSTKHPASQIAQCYIRRRELGYHISIMAREPDKWQLGHIDANSLLRRMMVKAPKEKTFSDARALDLMVTWFSHLRSHRKGWM